jgi:hypothetical protein
MCVSKNSKKDVGNGSGVSIPRLVKKSASSFSVGFEYIFSDIERVRRKENSNSTFVDHLALFRRIRSAWYDGVLSLEESERLFHKLFGIFRGLGKQPEDMMSVRDVQQRCKDLNIGMLRRIAENLGLKNVDCQSRGQLVKRISSCKYPSTAPCGLIRHVRLLIEKENVFQRTIELELEFQRIQYDVSGGLPRHKLVKQYLARAKPDLDRARKVACALCELKFLKKETEYLDILVDMRKAQRRQGGFVHRESLQALAGEMALAKWVKSQGGIEALKTHERCLGKEGLAGANVVIPKCIWSRLVRV